MDLTLLFLLGLNLQLYFLRNNENKQFMSIGKQIEKEQEAREEGQSNITF